MFILKLRIAGVSDEKRGLNGVPSFEKIAKFTPAALAKDLRGVVCVKGGVII
ncbi:LD-carboxypeptidase family [Mycoavidus cysteinexigens]|uniref:LD-carboxypeptidase family n=1 Tax=Mycoavidus cysteinexigens TaxID=1553431 RepID=A0A2Z6ETE9_9BURK|nr:LD-carboxypeptidase family [Mycoavidus cysteinexigens]GAM52605.1 hypothetical protein EBME_1068 [bacterium endosymbiont of Mortierella elongata FMR23-6]GLR01453.1 hypothetical protein GCM10007934_12650 [Mycoavidus cysteinexigens]